jgi:hypothetical protein
VLNSKVPSFRPTAVRLLGVAGVSALCMFACQGPDEYFRTGAVPGTGGYSSTGGDGTGNSNPGTGGGSTGGVIGTGGTPGTGGILATGGTKATGGMTGGGGRAGTSGGAGSPGTGGRIMGTGGAAGAGRAGSGGTVSTGGAGGAPAGKLVIDAYCQSGTSTQAITVYIDVLNNSTTQLALNSVTLRYWFTMGAITDMPKLEINYAVIGSGVITSKFVAVSPAVTGANEYLEIGFMKTAPTLALFSDSGQIQLAFHSTGYSSMFAPSQAMDYSFQKCGAGQAANSAPFNPAPTITGYIDGVLAYGTEPM